MINKIQLADGYPPADHGVASLLKSEKFPRPKEQRSLEQILFLSCILDTLAERLDRAKENSYSDVCTALWNDLKVLEPGTNEEPNQKRVNFINSILTQTDTLLGQSLDEIHAPEGIEWTPVKTLMQEEEKKDVKRKKVPVKRDEKGDDNIAQAPASDTEVDFLKRENFVEISIHFCS